MEPIWQIAAMKLYAITATIVALHLIGLAVVTAIVRGKHKVFLNPEDAKTFKGDPAEAEHPKVARVKRAHLNLIENAIPFLVVGFLYALTNPSALGANAYFWTFVGARLLHSVVYIAEKQPFRTLMFLIGALATVGMAVHVLRFAIAM